VPYAGELVDRDPPTCALTDTVADVRAVLDAARHGFCLVRNEQRTLLGRVRLSALDAADALASADSVMEPGPSTVRFNTPATDLVQRLAAKDLATAIVTTPGGCLVGAFDRADAQARLSHPGIP
jgi:CBS-domain-containing membrane protein